MSSTPLVDVSPALSGMAYKGLEHQLQGTGYLWPLPAPTCTHRRIIKNKSLKKKKSKGMVAQTVKAPASKPGDWSCNPRTHVAEEDS